MGDLRKCVDEIVMPRHSMKTKRTKKKRKYVAKGFIDTCTLKLTAHVSREMNERIISSMRSTFCFRFVDEFRSPRASIDVGAIGNMRPNTNRYTVLTRQTYGTDLCVLFHAFCAPISRRMAWNAERDFRCALTTGPTTHPFLPLDHSYTSRLVILS